MDEGEDEPSDPSSGEPENSQEGMSDLIYRSQPSIPFAGRKSRESLAIILHRRIF